MSKITLQKVVAGGVISITWSAMLIAALAVFFALNR
jgi:hypothetical protein